MQRRATSKRRAAEADKEIVMDDKEATPVEDLEEILPPIEPSRPIQTEELHERPAITGDINIMEMLKNMMEENRKSVESTNKNIESLKEDSQ